MNEWKKCGFKEIDIIAVIKALTIYFDEDISSFIVVEEVSFSTVTFFCLTFFFFLLMTANFLSLLANKASQWNQRGCIA